MLAVLEEVAKAITMEDHVNEVACAKFDVQKAPPPRVFNVTVNAVPSLLYIPGIVANYSMRV